MDYDAPIEILDTVPSTMDAARDRIVSGQVTFDADGQPSAMGIMAREQTSGRGQRGRAWFARPGESLCATYYIRHGFSLPDQADRVSLMAGVAVAGLLNTLRMPLNPALKWPNDLLLNQKKAGGILIEMVQAPDGGRAVLVGIGINVTIAEFPPELRDTATSLLLEAPDLPPIDIEWLARAVGMALNVYAVSNSRLAMAAWVQIWREFDGTTGRRYTTDWQGASVTGAAVGINEEGALLLRLEGGRHIPVTCASSLREVTESS